VLLISDASLDDAHVQLRESVILEIGDWAEGEFHFREDAHQVFIQI
jgi:hypothetical protein